MTTVYKIPLDSGNQKFSLTVGNTEYRVELIYRDIDEGGWDLTLKDSDGNDLIAGIPLVTGCNLLEQYQTVIVGSLWVEVEGQDDAVPSYDDMGSSVLMYMEV